MSDNAQHEPMKLRTFAADLEREKARHGQKPAAKPAATIPVANKAAPAHAPTAHKKPKPQPVQTSPQTTAPAATKKSEVKRNTTIPAFHEIEKQTKAIQENIVVASERSGKTKKATTEAHRLNIGFDATVITDTKANRFRLFPSIVDSLTNWFKKLSFRRRKKKAPQYVIPETERRKGVIQKATSKTGTIFTADNQTLREQIRRRQQQDREREDIDLNWSPFTDSGYNLLEAAEDAELQTPQNVVVEYKAQHKKAAPTAAPSPAPTKEPVIPEPVYVEPTTTPEVPAPPATLPTGELPAVLETKPEPEVTPPTEPYTRPSRSAKTPHSLYTADTNTQTVLILVAIVGLLALLVAGKLLVTYLSTQAATESTSQYAPTETLLHSTTLHTATVSPEQLSAVDSVVLATTVAAPSGFVEIALVTPLGEEINPAYLFDALDFNTLPTLQQSLTAARFVTINNGAPALVLQFIDTDTVIGGLLQWEDTMVEDFSQFSDVAPTEEASFVDEQFIGHDVRVLRLNDTAVLMYSVINDNTAIIATSQTDFAQIVELGFGE